MELFAPTQPGLVLDLPDANYGSAVRLGLWILSFGFGGFLVWAILAPLDEGGPAAGVVAVESKSKRIDHLAGGLVEKIFVREGQKVREGQVMITLNETQVKAALGSTLSQWRSAVAAEARLNAEREKLTSIHFPKELVDEANDPEVEKIIEAQRRLFRSRRAALEGEIAIIRESVRGLTLQLGSLDQLRAGREKQVLLFQEQLASYQKLNKVGFISRNQLIVTERELAEVQTKQSEDLSNIAGVNARLAEFRMRGEQREAEYRREIESEITQVQKEVATLADRLSGLRDTYMRLAIRAPVSGTVVDLAFHTIGGVIKPGDRIMDIVPEGDELIVEAQVPPQYIDRVHAG
ncbi:MAG: HlyD family type I secretion periplasmic adaptor subunit, partial [Burkholderiales bacterium]